MPSSLAAALARPLEEDWRASIDRVARAHKWPTSAEPAQLGALVRALSDAYNAPNALPLGRAVAASGPALAARLGFSFARDVPKAAAAVRELVAGRQINLAGAPPRLRVLDIGAGLGATTWGVARALSAAGLPAALQVTWTDEDVLALDVASQLARERDHRDGEVTLEIHVERKRASPELAGRDPWDLILLGQVLSELDPGIEPEPRAARHAQLLGSLVSKLAPGGALVIVEPALRERTRHLHAVRDAVLAAGAASVFAPCLHTASCPALEVAGEWCHEDVSVDLPPWLEPVARAAGLRWQGLTFSYLVLRRTGERTLSRLLGDAPGARARIISGPLVTKGKREHFVCGEEAVRARVSRLDRDADESNGLWSSLERGDLIAIHPRPDPKKNRIARGAEVIRLEPGPPPPAPPREHDDLAPPAPEVTKTERALPRP
jgi:ribosomal protein RSM22 (predicted rRNA methylase)